MVVKDNAVIETKGEPRKKTELPVSLTIIIRTEFEDIFQKWQALDGSG